MESNVCGSENLPMDTENASLNEAIPAVTPAPTADLPKDASGILTTAVECDDAISSTTPDKFTEDLEDNTMSAGKPSTSSETDADFFTSELSISDVPTEKITENVEDIVQDLENLLGESNDSYRFSRESFDNSKLADSYDEVNSSNVTDLFTEQSNLDVPSYQCSILPDASVSDVSVTPSDNIESELKDAEVNVPTIVEVVEPTKSIDIVSVIEDTLKDVVSVPPVADVLDIPEEVDTVININALIESQIESEETHNNDAARSEILNLQDVIATETVPEDNAVLKLEMETLKEDSVDEGISNNKMCHEVQPSLDVAEICEGLEEIQQIEGLNVDQIPTTCEQSCENATELIEELIKDSVSVNIDSMCIENLLGVSSKDGLKEIDTEEKGEHSLPEENIVLQETKADFSGKSEDNPSEESDLPQILIESNSLQEVLATNIKESADERVERSLEIVKEQEQVEEVVFKTNEESNVVRDVQKEISDTSEAIPAPALKTSDDQEAKLEPESSDVAVNEQNITELDDSNIISTKLAQPLTVEVEDPDVSEQQLTVVATQEQTAKNDVPSKEAQKSEVVDLKQTVSVDADTTQTNRAPLKMTITKHKSDNVHSILKIYDPNDAESNQEQHIPKLIIKSTPTSTTSDDPEQSEEQTIPKITIKSVLTPTESPHSPRLTIKPIKPEITEKQSSPKSAKASSSGTRITIKPVIKPESLSPLRLTLRPYPKLEEVPSSPKLNIKPILKPTEETTSIETHHSPKITIKPIVKPPEEVESSVEERHSPRITIKPILKPVEEENQVDERHSPRITIKPVVKPSEEAVKEDENRQSPRITIKPVVKPPEEDTKEDEERHSPRITIKPIVKPPEDVIKENEERHSPRITIKPVVKPSEEAIKVDEEKHSPRITIKAVVKPPEEVMKVDEEKHSPRITIKPVVKAIEEVIREDEEKQSPRITIKPVVKPPEEVMKVDEEKHSPRITIKPVVKPSEEVMKVDEEKHSPRITIKPVVKPSEEAIREDEEKHSPRITIKPVVKPIDDEEKHSPRITIKPIIKPNDDQGASSYHEERHSPKVTIKPVKKLVEEETEGCTDERQNPRIIKSVVDLTKEEISSYSEEKHSPRITIKPVVKPPEESAKEETQVSSEEKPSPRITIKPVLKPLEESAQEEIQCFSEEKHHSPRITIKPIIKPPEETVKEELQEEKHSPRITIKPVMKPVESETENTHGPRITIKPVVKPQEDPKQTDEMSVIAVQPFKLNIKPIVKRPECSPSPKVTIKPVTKPPEADDEPVELIDFEEQIKQERIVLKIAKNTKKERESEKLKKIKVKLSKERGLARIVQGGFKRSSTDEAEQELKHFKSELPSDLTISLVSNTSNTAHVPDVTITRIESSSGMSTNINQDGPGDLKTLPKQKQEQQMSSFFSAEEMPDPLAEIPIFEITLESANAMCSAPSRPTTAVAPAVAGVPPTPRKRGRPRKVPLEVREEFKDPKEEETPPPVVEESSRPKRSCRGASVKATLGIKPRKPRAPSTRGRGGKRTVSTRATAAKKTKERKLSPSKLKLSKELMVKDQPDFKEFETKDAEFKQVPLPAESGNREVVIYEEETRMSAENSSRAQTPAKQVLVSSTEVIEESQSSVQSNTTTESGEKTQKIRKGPRLEVHQEPEGEVISADKLAEYSWGGGGPYMLQEQVAQFLGIKSFKRKYPGIQRRPVDMQERDFIRESCLASEAMCDMGLTAVRSEDILDIMYTDFQHKYEEYCKHQRDRQAKDVSNKQKALSLAASQEKNKLDIVEQAVQSAFQWNANFNKARREQRRACMDLQTFTVHFPKGKMKQVNKPPIGHYPLALVPGQFTDYYKKYNCQELANLPLNTMGCKTVSISNTNQDTEESQSDGSGSDSDSSSSDSDSSDSSSGAEDCKMCTPAAHASKKMLVH